MNGAVTTRWGRLSREFHRSFWAGCAAFGSDFVVLLLLTELAGLNYLLANLFSFAAGLLVSYVLSIKVVFERRRYGHAGKEFLLFALLALISLLFNEGLLYAGVEWLGMHYAPAKAVAAVLVFCCNFVLRKAVLF